MKLKYFFSATLVVLFSLQLSAQSPSSKFIKKYQNLKDAHYTANTQTGKDSITHAPIEIYVQTLVFEDYSDNKENKKAVDDFRSILKRNDYKTISAVKDEDNNLNIASYNKDKYSEIVFLTQSEEDHFGVVIISANNLTEAQKKQMANFKISN